MAFRDHLTHARLVQDETSLIHGVWNYSRAHNHPMLLFDNISEAKGQKIALNMLTRDRLCEAAVYRIRQAEAGEARTARLGPGRRSYPRADARPT